MKIVVSGADGFLGSHVLELLRLDSNWEVVGITVDPVKLSKVFSGWKELRVVKANLDSMAKQPLLSNADVYLACAFPRAVGYEGMAEGLNFVYGSLGLMIDKGCRSVINISSQSVYDPHRTKPAKETDDVLLTSTYAATKYCVELSVARMCGERNSLC